MENVRHTRNFGCLRTLFVIGICSFACCFIAGIFQVGIQEWAFAIHGYFNKATVCQKEAQNPPRLRPAQDYSVNVPIAADIVITPDNALRLQRLGMYEAQLFQPLLDANWHPNQDYFIARDWILYSISVYACSTDGKGIAYIGNYSEGFKEGNGVYPVILQWHLSGDNAVLSFLDDLPDCINLFNAKSIERINHICHSDSYAEFSGTVSIHPSEPLIAIGESNLGTYYVNIFNMQNRQHIMRVHYPSRIHRLDFNDEGTLLGINAQDWWGIASE